MAALRLFFLALGFGVAGCGDARPPPPGGLSCEDDPRCGGARPEDLVPGEDSAISDDFRSRCEDPATDSSLATAGIGFFRDSFDPTDLSPFDTSASVFSRAATAGAFACAEVSGGALFQLWNATDEPGPMRLQPSNVESAFFHSLMNRVDFQEMPLTIPVFPRALINDVFREIGATWDPERATLLIEVTDPTGFFEDSARPRHAGSSFVAGGAEEIAYRVNRRWTTSASETSSDGLALIVNLPADVGLGRQVQVTQSEAEGTSLERYLWAAKGAITFAAMPPAR